MSCTKHFLGFTWERHTWRKRVTSYETLAGQETNMWARVVYKDFVRCDKHEVCDDCGAVRHQVSCMCDAKRAEQCKLLQDSITEMRRSA